MTNRGDKTWIINGANGDLQPGDYRCRLVRGGPYVPVRVRESIPTDDEGNAIGDATYEVWVDGRLVDDYLAEFPQGLVGIDADRFQAIERDEAATALEQKMREQVKAKGEPVDLMKAPLPF